MSKAGEERYVFETEWFDIQAQIIRKYLFTFFPTDSTIEMVSEQPMWARGLLQSIITAKSPISQVMLIVG